MDMWDFIKGEWQRLKDDDRRKELETVISILDFAISREVESHRLYTETAEAAVLNKAARDVLRDLAQEEKTHRTRLERMKTQLEEELANLPPEEPKP
jgi:rubrerythrin